MFAAEKEVRRWREEVERRSSLSPREVDELEDHLRARVELEMELAPALGPAKALAIAKGHLGEATALSREFARAGPRWSRWMVSGLAMFGVSFFMPVIEDLYWPIRFVSVGDNPLVVLGIGYWAWFASFGCIATALWLRDREWSPAKVKEVVA